MNKVLALEPQGQEPRIHRITARHQAAARRDGTIRKQAEDAVRILSIQLQGSRAMAVVEDCGAEIAFDDNASPPLANSDRAREVGAKAPLHLEDGPGPAATAWGTLWGELCCRDAQGPATEKVENCREIVRSQRPPRTHVLGVLTAVVPRTGDPTRGAQVPVRDHAAQPLDRGVIQQLMTDHQHQRVLGSGDNERLRLCSLEAEGFLDEDMLPGSQSRCRQSEVGLSRSAHRDRIDPGVAPQLL